MLAVRISSDPAEIRAMVPEADRILKGQASALPFNCLEVPLIWWKHFENNDGSDFGEKRGRNFWGVSSQVLGLHLLSATDGTEVCGLLPLMTIRVKVKGRPEPLLMLSFPADSALVAYQDFLVRADNREVVLAALLEAALSLAKEKHDCLFLGYFSDRSPNLNWLREAASKCLANGWSGGITPTRRRGGVHPWTHYPLLDSLKKIRAKLDGTHANAEALSEIFTKLEATTPGMLLFLKTRQNLEEAIRKAVHGLENQESIASELAVISEQLKPALILYPFLALPKEKEAYLMDMSHDTRRYFNRYKKRFLEAGGSFEKVAAENLTQADIDEYLDLHLMRWGADSVSVRTGTLAFHRDLGLALGKRGMFSLFFARHEGKRIASHSCLDVNGRREGFFNGRDPATEELRAGRLLYMETLLDAIDLNYAEYNFGLGGYDYKTSFTKTFANTHNLFLFPHDRPVDPTAVFSGYELISFSD